MNEASDLSWSNSAIALQGQRPGDIRRNNRAVALTLLRDQPRGRAELSREMNLSKAALGDLMAQLIGEHLVQENPPTPRSRGRHPAPLAINRARFSVIGIDLAVHGLEVGLYDALGQTLAVEEQASGVGTGAEAVYARVLSAAKTMIAKAAALRAGAVLAVGIAAPGPVDLWHGLVLSPPNFADISGLALKNRLEADLNVTVLLERDATAATLAHLRQTKAENFVYLLLSAGIGAGVVISRRVFKGVHGFAGEFGHVSVHHDGTVCACGNRGCVENYAGSAMIEAAYARQPSSRTKAESTPSILEIAARARAGEARAIEVFRVAGEALGLACVTLVNLFDPKQIVLGGPGSAWADVLLPHMRAMLTERAYPFLSWGAQLPIEISALKRPIGTGAAERVLEAVFRGEIQIPAYVKPTPSQTVKPRAAAAKREEPLMT